MAEAERARNGFNGDLSVQLYQARDTIGFAGGDVTLKAKTGSYKVHGCVLASRFPAFAAVLKTDMTDDKVVKFEHVDDAIVKHLIEYIYLEEAYVLQDDLPELLKFAFQYRLKYLIDDCWRCLMKTLTPDTTVDLLLLAEKYGGQEEKDKVNKYLLGNHGAVMGTPKYSQLIKEHPELYLRVCGNLTSHEEEADRPIRRIENKQWKLGERRTAGSLQIFLKSLSGHITCMTVELSDTVSMLKAQIYLTLAIPVEHQRLVYGGTLMECSQTLSYYNIKNESTINYILRCRGGGNVVKLMSKHVFKTLSEYLHHYLKL